MRSRFRYWRPSARVGVLTLAALLSVGGGASGARAQQPQSAGEELDVVRIRPNVFMIAGAGGNIVVQIGPIGVIVVDTGAVQYADKVLAAVKRLTSLPIRYIINTSADADHVGGNETLSKAGVTILSGAIGNVGIGADVITAGGVASILAHENVLTRMGEDGTPFGLWPTKVYGGRGYRMYLNGNGIQVLPQPAAHSDGDSIVVFRQADVIVAGDVIDADHFPMIDLAKGGSIQGELDAINRVWDLVIPPFPLIWQEDRTYVIPGHGRIMDNHDVEEYRDNITIVRNVIQDMIRQGMTLAQVQAADPAKAFRPLYGSGAWTTERFVEAVYRSLTAK